MRRTIGRAALFWVEAEGFRVENRGGLGRCWRGGGSFGFAQDDRGIG
jgi:hypothetical protein